MAGKLRKPSPFRRAKIAKSRLEKADSAILDPVVFKDYEEYFNPSLTSIEKFIGLFEIDTDRPDEDGDGVQRVPFVPRKLQRRLLRYITRVCWKKKKRAARVMNLKGRRYGMTTFFIIFGLERILRVEDYNVLLVAQDDVMAKVHFARVRSLFRQIPEWVLAALDITVLKDTDNEITLRHGQYKQSSFRVAPAKRNALGRGDRVNMLLLTEYPQWPNSAKGDLTGLLRTCNRARGNVTVFESTARGHEEFYERCKKAWEKKSDYHFFFIPAFEHPDAHLAFESPEAMDAFERTIGVNDEYGGEEETELHRFLLRERGWKREKVLTHLNNRRSVLMSEYGGHLPYYHREEPNTPKEAFEGTGRPVFDLIRLNAWRKVAEKQERKARVGEFRRREGKVVFEEKRRGRWTLFEEPDLKETYCFGSDVASGQVRHANASTEADFSTCKLKHVLSGRTVARFHAHIKPSLLAEEVLLGALYFNAAEGHVEVNMDGGTTVDRLEEAEYMGVCGIDLVLCRRVFERTEGGKKESRVPGFRTTSKTKHGIVRAVQDFIEEMGPVFEDRVCPIDVMTIDELLRFQIPDTGGAGEAATGHDDLVIDEGLCLLAREEVWEDMPKSSLVPGSRPVDGTELHFMRVAEVEKAESDGMLGSMF